MMPEFYQNMKLHKHKAVFDLLGIVVLIILLALNLMAWNPWMLTLCLGIGVVYAYSQYRDHKAGKSQDMTPWKVCIPCEGSDEFLARLHSEEITDNCYVSFGSRGRYRVRLLVACLSPFTAGTASQLRQRANRKINVKYGVKAEGSSYEVARQVRVNLAMTDIVNEDLVKWVKRTELTLYRAEVIVNLALCKDEGVLLVPKLRRGHNLNQVMRYEAAVLSTIERLFGEESEKTTNGW